MIAENQLRAGLRVSYMEPGNVISKGAECERTVEIMWVEQGHVHYREGTATTIRQTPTDRFLEIVNGGGGAIDA